MTSCKFLHYLRSVIFDILGTPEEIDFIEDERAKQYLKSFGKTKKTPFSKIFKYLPKHAE